LKRLEGNPYLKKVMYVAIIMKNIFLALDEIHKNNMIHRDLKPENLIFANDDLSTVKISDFGLSTKFKGGKIFLRCGSPGYVAPEVLNDEGYD
jgi:calcium/calmodulin-dependent protein kinase I